MRDLTNAQRELFIELHLIKNSGIINITRPQIAKRMKIDINSFKWLLSKLEEKGYVDASKGYIIVKEYKK
jgi:Mn-dependent DtxR family transcriptional regulator